MILTADDLAALNSNKLDYYDHYKSFSANTNHTTAILQTCAEIDSQIKKYRRSMIPFKYTISGNDSFLGFVNFFDSSIENYAGMVFSFANSLYLMNFRRVDGNFWLVRYTGQQI